MRFWADFLRHLHQCGQIGEDLAGRLPPWLSSNRLPRYTAVEKPEFLVAQVHLGRSIVNMLLLHALSRSPVVEDGTPIGTIMLQLFTLLCRPEGQDLVASINGPGAPLVIEHDKSAVPVVTDE